VLRTVGGEGGGGTALATHVANVSGPMLREFEERVEACAVANCSGPLHGRCLTVPLPPAGAASGGGDGGGDAVSSSGVVEEEGAAAAVMASGGGGTVCECRPPWTGPTCATAAAAVAAAAAAQGMP
jgi:hypothetical protein